MKTFLALALAGLLAACTNMAPPKEKEDVLIPTTPSESAATATKDRE